MYKPKLEIPFHYAFEKRHRATGRIAPDSVAKEFTLVPLDKAAKKRHYFIYSESCYGKTYFLNLLEVNLNACFVTDSNNFFNAGESAQLLLFDDVDPWKRLSSPVLRSLCTGCGIKRKRTEFSSPGRRTSGDVWHRVAVRPVQTVGHRLSPLPDAHGGSRDFRSPVFRDQTGRRTGKL